MTDINVRCTIEVDGEAFEQWGPLNERGRPIRDGSNFRIWVNCLRYLGYRLEWRKLRACDYGTPTTRNRLFVVARCDGKPIIWPEVTHGSVAVEGSGSSAGRHDAGDDDQHRKRPRAAERRSNAEGHATDSPAWFKAHGASSARRENQAHRYGPGLKPYVPAEAWRLHQSFKREFISSMSRDGGSIPTKTIREWINQHALQEEAARALESAGKD